LANASSHRMRGTMQLLNTPPWGEHRLSRRPRAPIPPR
jgi:hypothetical protein